MISSNSFRPAGMEIRRRSRMFGWIEISLIALILALGILGVSSSSAAQASSDAPQSNSPLYIPLAVNSLSTHVDDIDVTLPPCELTDLERGVLELAEAHSDQGRPVFECHSILLAAARAKAKDMADRDYVAHTDPDGQGPNAMVWEAGFRLPDWYPNDGTANNIESIGAGYATPQDVFNAWLNSKYHRIHLLATDSFYADQHQVAIGHYYDVNTTYRHYWVFLSAPTVDLTR